VPPPSGMSPGTRAAAVVRGPLLFALRLAETETVVKMWPTFNNTDIDIKTQTPWNVALKLKGTGAMPSTEGLTFVRSAGGGANCELPFNTSNYFGWITAPATTLPGWIEATNAASEPPPSPVDCAKVKGGCGASSTVVLVPYGATNLRVAALPWIITNE